jgi:hypothetical protein
MLRRDDPALSVFLMHEWLKGEASFFHPFLQMMPHPETISDWSDRRLRELQDDDLIQEARARDVRLMHNYLKIFEVLSPTYPACFPPERFTYKLFRWAFNQIQARAFGRRLPWTAMVPFADTLNHSNVQVKYDYNVEGNGCFRMWPSGLNSYAKGGEVFNSYGRRGGKHLLLDYGFTLPLNEWDEAKLVLNAQLEEEQQQEGEEEGGDFTDSDEDFEDALRHVEEEAKKEVVEGGVKEGGVKPSLTVALPSSQSKRTPLRKSRAMSLSSRRRELLLRVGLKPEGQQYKIKPGGLCLPALAFCRIACASEAEMERVCPHEEPRVVPKVEPRVEAELGAKDVALDVQGGVRTGTADGTDSDPKGDGAAGGAAGAGAERTRRAYSVSGLRNSSGISSGNSSSTGSRRARPVSQRTFIASRLSLRNEIDALSLLAAACEAALRVYPTSLSSDEQQLQWMEQCASGNDNADDAQNASGGEGSSMLPVTQPGVPLDWNASGGGGGLSARPGADLDWTLLNALRYRVQQKRILTQQLETARLMRQFITGVERIAGVQPSGPSQGSNALPLYPEMLSCYLESVLLTQDSRTDSNRLKSYRPPSSSAPSTSSASPLSSSASPPTPPVLSSLSSHSYAPSSIISISSFNSKMASIHQAHAQRALLEGRGGDIAGAAWDRWGGGGSFADSLKLQPLQR